MHYLYNFFMSYLIFILRYLKSKLEVKIFSFIVFLSEEQQLKTKLT